MFLVNGFEPIEAITTIDILLRCKLDVRTVALGQEALVEGAHGITVKCDEVFNKDNSESFDCIVAPGGPGVDNYFLHNEFLELIKNFNEKGKLLAFICAGPKVLATLDILSNKEYTSYPSVKDFIAEKGGIYKNLPAVKCENIITGKSAGATKDFATLIASQFISEEDVEEVINSMYY